MKEQQQKICFEETDDKSQTLSMFRKYLFCKAQNKVGKTSMEESQVLIKRKRSGPLPLVPPPMFGTHMPRQASLLEQALLPGNRSDLIQSQSEGKSSSGAAQLTIFYEGEINVYDNIPADKAQAIMLLAGESSASKTIAIQVPKAEENKPMNLISACKLQAELPITRKLSLQHFLEKRRHRIACKSPYSSPKAPQQYQESESREDSYKDSNADHTTISLPPFPSRLGYSFPVSANKGPY